MNKSLFIYNLNTIIYTYDCNAAIINIVLKLYYKCSAFLAIAVIQALPFPDCISFHQVVTFVIVVEMHLMFFTIILKIRTSSGFHLIILLMDMNVSLSLFVKNHKIKKIGLKISLYNSSITCHKTFQCMRKKSETHQKLFPSV